MLGQRGAEFVMSIGVSDEIPVGDLRGIQRGDEARATRRRDRPGWKARVEIGVVRRLDLEILVHNSRSVTAECVLNGGVSLEKHSLAEPVVIHSGNHGA